MSEVLIEAKNVGKKFCRDLKTSLWYGVKDATHDLFGAQTREAILRRHEFWANSDVSLTVRRGDCLAVIGKNGAGKTTLLKLLTGLIKPDSGTIRIRGRIGSMIALGAGFNPVLTGRENVYVNASILGLRKKEIDREIDRIIEFSGIDEFIDSPVRSYSSGMQVRLGFAVATALKPDVLILDEVLAVGDAAFRSRCYNRVGEMLEDTAVVIVTHSMEHVTRVCNRGLLLSNGRPVYSGDATTAAMRYDTINSQSPQSTAAFTELQLPIIRFEPRPIEHYRGKNQHFSLTFDVESKAEFDCHFRIQLYNESGQLVTETDSSSSTWFRCRDGKNQVTVRFGAINLNAGTFFFSILLQDKTRLRNLVWSYKEASFSVDGPRSASTPIVLKTLDTEVTI